MALWLWCRPGVLGADHGGTRSETTGPLPARRWSRRSSVSTPPSRMEAGRRQSRPARARRHAVGAASRVRARGGTARGLPQPPAPHRPWADDLAALHRRADDGPPAPRTATTGCSRSEPDRAIRRPCWPELAAEVFSIEIVEPLGLEAARTLDRLGIGNVKTRIGDGYAGWPEHAPYDAIIVTAAPEHIPAQLVEQLRPGGRLVIPVGGLDQDLMVVEKKADGPHDLDRDHPGALRSLDAREDGVNLTNRHRNCDDWICESAFARLGQRSSRSRAAAERIWETKDGRPRPVRARDPHLQRRRQGVGHRTPPSSSPTAGSHCSSARRASRRCRWARAFPSSRASYRPCYLVVKVAGG